MATVSVSVSDELKKRMNARQDVNWSAIARNAFANQLTNQEQLDLLNNLIANSKATDKDVMEISKKINKGIATRIEKEIALRKILNKKARE